MTQQSPQATNPLNVFNRCILLKQGVGLIGSLGVLSSALLSTQLQAEASTSSLVIPVTPAVPATPAPVKTSQPATRTAPVQAPVSRLAAPSFTPTTTKPKKIQLSAPRVSTSSPPAVEMPSKAGGFIIPQAQSTGIQPTVKLPQAGKNSYIDTTSYSRGVRRNYTGPNSVVLTERSTGCRTTVSRNGKLSRGICGSTALRQPTAFRSRKASRTVRAFRSKFQGTRANRGQNSSASQASTPKYNRATRPIGRSGNGNTALLFPLSIPTTITSVFGWRIHPITGTRRMHSGTDLGAPLGTPVLAAYRGEVAIADWLRGYGLTVTLRHEEGTQESRYAHLSEIFVQSGELIEQGTVIGLVGSTGNSTGPHLHFEWRHLTNSGWVAVDAGVHLEYAMENLIRSMQLAEASSDAQS